MSAKFLIITAVIVAGWLIAFKLFGPYVNISSREQKWFIFLFIFMLIAIGLVYFLTDGTFRIR
jgi:TRAP-type mannitol/chloroaromatic compound transport system permease small subunit